jgi:methyl-accepting chemotaxis protein
MKYAKINLSHIIMCVVCLLLLTGCCTTRARGTSDDILNNQAAVTELATRLSDYNSNVRRDIESLESIRNREASSGDTIEELIRLFEEYERCVEQLVRDYNNLRAEIESTNEGAANLDRNSSN